MKTTALKVFASCVAIVCLASSPVARATPLLKSVSATSENPIVEKQGVRQHNNFDGQSVVDLKPYDSRLMANDLVQKLAMAVHETIMVSQKLYRQRRSYDPELEHRLRKEIEGDDSSMSVSPESNDAIPVSPNSSNEVLQDQLSNEIQTSQQSNEVQNSQQSNEVQNSQQSNEVQNSQQSNEVQESQQSNEVQNSQQSNEAQDFQQSDEVQNSQQSNEEYRASGGISEHNSYQLNESDEGEGSYQSDDSSDDSVSTDDDYDESDKIKPTPLLRTTF